MHSRTVDGPAESDADNHESEPQAIDGQRREPHEEAGDDQRENAVAEHAHALKERPGQCEQPTEGTTKS